MASEAEQGKGDEGLGGLKSERHPGDQPDLGVQAYLEGRPPVGVSPAGLCRGHVLDGEIVRGSGTRRAAWDGGGTVFTEVGGELRAKLVVLGAECSEVFQQVLHALL